MFFTRRDQQHSDHVAGPITHRMWSVLSFPDLKLQIAVVSSYLLAYWSYHGMPLTYWYLPSPFATFSCYCMSASTSGPIFLESPLACQQLRPQAPHLVVEFDGYTWRDPHSKFPLLTLMTPVSPFLTPDNTFVGSTSVSFLSHTPVCPTTRPGHQDLPVSSLSRSISYYFS